MTPGAGVLMLRRGHVSHYGEYAISLLDTLIDLYSGIIMKHSYTIVDFYLFYNGAVDMQI